MREFREFASALPQPYLFGFDRGSGTCEGHWHFPVPEAVPVTRPEALRRNPVTEHAKLPPVVAVSVNFPEAPRVTARSTLPTCFWRSMV